MAEITSPDYPGERLIACYNPFLAADRGPASPATCWPPPRPNWRRSPRPPAARRPLRGKDNIALAVGKVINNKKVAKHFVTEITDEGPGLAAG